MSNQANTSAHTSGDKRQGRWRRGRIAAVIVGLLAASAGALAIGARSYDVGVTTPHSAPVEWALRRGMEASIRAHAENVVIPDGNKLDDPRLAERAIGHYSVACAQCHGAPGHEHPHGERGSGLTAREGCDDLGPQRSGKQDSQGGWSESTYVRLRSISREPQSLLFVLSARMPAAGCAWRARAVQAAVVRARPAGTNNLLAERLSSSEDSHASVVCRNAGLRCEILHKQAVDLHRAQGVGVLVFECGRELGDTLADGSARFEIGLQMLFDFPPESGQLALCRSASPMVIDNGVSEQPIEPGHGRLVRAQRLELIHASNERVLQDVLRQRPAAHAPFQKPQELTVVRHQ